MHYILHSDRKKYVYMRDVGSNSLLFAVTLDQYDLFNEVLNLYRTDPHEIPDDYTLEVIKMTEVSDDVYTMTDEKPLRYPMNNLDYAWAMPFESA